MFSQDIVIFIPSFLEAEKIFNIQHFKKISYFHTATYKNKTVIITGVGKTNSAYTATLFYSQHQATHSLLTGLCGAYEENSINIGDIVSITKDYLVDECNYNGLSLTTLHEKGFLKDNEFMAQFANTQNHINVTSNTVSLIANEENLVKKYQQKTNAQVENMEGASFGIVANKFNITPYHIRTVSNFATTIEKQKWDIKKAAKNLKESIDYFLNSFYQ